MDLTITLGEKEISSAIHTYVASKCLFPLEGELDVTLVPARGTQEASAVIKIMTPKVEVPEEEKSPVATKPRAKSKDVTPEMTPVIPDAPVVPQAPVAEPPKEVKVEPVVVTPAIQEQTDSLFNAAKAPEVTFDENTVAEGALELEALFGS